MKQNYISHFIGGVSLGIGVLLGIGIIYIAQAVDPGTIPNPTFGPNNQNVDIQTGIECSWTGEQPMQIGCNWGTTNFCVWMNVTCDGSAVTGFREGGAWADEGVNLNCNTGCGILW